jgi:hypothetical protein
MDEPPKPDVWIVDTTSRIRSSPAMAAFGILSYVPNFKTHGSTFRIRRANKDHWFEFPIGRAGFAISATISTDKQRIGVELYNHNDPNKAAFNRLHADKEAIEQEFGEPLDWQELLGKKASRIAIFRHGVDPSDENQRGEQHAWMLARMDRFRKVFAGRVRTLNFAPVSDAEDTEDAPDQ